MFGTLFRECPADVVLPIASRYMTTATDILRLIAVMSGTDGSLQRETIFQQYERTEGQSRFWGDIAKLLGAKPHGVSRTTATIPLRVNRFKVAKLSRPLRRSLLNLLERIDGERLIEDMLRHRSYWVWVGEFLHPGEWDKRFPNVARAFQIVRKKDESGRAAPPFQTWYGRLEEAAEDRKADALLAILSERPGEFARRFDFALRVAGDDLSAVDNIVKSFIERVPALATPVLLTLRNHLPKRRERAQFRLYWPKGQIAKGVSGADTRASLPSRAIEPTIRAIDAELLRRFSKKAAFSQCIVDEELRTVLVPFNERTASAAAVSLPRGSEIDVPIEKTIRLFLHWCQPEGNDHASDLDLSVALYDKDWQYLAMEMGARFAVVVINNYAGLPFTLLERGFAGLMFRDDAMGHHFDPRTVHLKFALSGENGIFLPLVLDLFERKLHWLDVQSTGQFAFNNVENSKSAIAKLCPELIEYFSSGIRPSMFDLALLHGAARCERVMVRGREPKNFVRRNGEERIAFYQRIVHGESDGHGLSSLELNNDQVLAVLFQGDLDLPEGSSAYALFRERVIPTISASDLIA